MQINPTEVLKEKIVYNLFNEEKQVQQNGIDLTTDADIKIESGKYVNVVFNEKFDMKNSFGLIRIRSSLARKGLILQSGIFDSGFNGMGGCMLHNLSDVDVVFSKGFRVCQIIVFKGNPHSLYDGVYNTKKDTKSQYTGGVLDDKQI
jgi:deoxycytidine triphosphate deaminase